MGMTSETGDVWNVSEVAIAIVVFASMVFSVVRTYISIADIQSSMASGSSLFGALLDIGWMNAIGIMIFIIWVVFFTGLIMSTTCRPA